MPRSLIIGAAGQDGKLLCERLISQGETVLPVGHGWIENKIGNRLPFDLHDKTAIQQILEEASVDRVFYLAAYHHSSSQSESLDSEVLWERSVSVHVNGFRNILESIKSLKKSIPIFYAASSLVFGNPEEAPQTEVSPMRPVCIYGITKVTGVHLAQWYRRTYKVPVSVGILYTHESLNRGDHFVAKRIVNGLKEIVQGNQNELVLGDLNAAVDWGYAPDFVRAIDEVTQIDRQGDYIIATNEIHTVAEFAQIACQKLGLPFSEVVREDPALVVRQRRKLQGDYRKLHQSTGWRPSISFQEMVEKLLQPL